MEQKKEMPTLSRSFYFLFLALSFCIVAFGQPAWVGFFGYFASFVGYALFWWAMIQLPLKRHRFFLASFWFSGVQAIQLNWMISTTYQGTYILVVYGFLIVSMGLEFGILSLIIPQKPPFTIRRMLALASFWILFEWTRLLVLTGFTWNPVGMALTNNHFSMQLAVVAGIFGLSFWVIFVNAFGLRALAFNRTRLSLGIWFFFALFPYLFGIGHQLIQTKRFSKKDSLSVLLIQTALLPEQKEPIPPHTHLFLSPVHQWNRILTFIDDEVKKRKINLIVLPEAALPFGAYYPFYPQESVRRLWIAKFGIGSAASLPPLKEPYAKAERKLKGGVEEMQWKVGNAYWAQALSNQFNAEVIVGFDHRDIKTKKNYNAAFHFIPYEPMIRMYEKRVLVPLGEYIPFDWCNTLARKFGIYDSFTPGKKAKIFSMKKPLGISICYEETYGHIMRESRQLGAEYFVNITNDVWFPGTRLPQQHFYHGILRGVENGVPTVRACNTGVTGAVDCFGRIIKVLYSEEISSEKIAGALHVLLPTYHYSTLYTFWGDGFIIGMSVILGLLFLRSRK